MDPGLDPAGAGWRPTLDNGHDQKCNSHAERKRIDRLIDRLILLRAIVRQQL
jgi:hypothetical protein